MIIWNIIKTYIFNIYLDVRNVFHLMLDSQTLTCGKHTRSSMARMWVQVFDKRNEPIMTASNLFSTVRLYIPANSWLYLSFTHTNIWQQLYARVGGCCLKLVSNVCCTPPPTMASYSSIIYSRIPLLDLCRKFVSDCLIHHPLDSPKTSQRK